MVQARSARELAADSGLIDLLWTVTSREREQALRPVRIPIFRGLYGWRLLLVRRGDTERFAAVRSLADLQPLRLLQGADWPDTRVLRDNGLRVETAQSFESLFNMLQAARGDAFPRGVTEIGWEQLQRSDRFQVEPSLALHYPSAEYYFVSQRNRSLAELLEQGLERMQASGEHEELLLDIHGEALRAARLHQRRTLSLRNAELPEATPLRRRALWWRPT
jgi:ABC-type amino acid transport substrate-binding protein